jgi:hypothetical protein
MDNSLFSWDLTKRDSLFGLHPLDIKTPARRTILPVSAMDTLCLGPLHGWLGIPWTLYNVDVFLLYSSLSAALVFLS